MHHSLFVESNGSLHAEPLELTYDAMQRPHAPTFHELGGKKYRNRGLAYGPAGQFAFVYVEQAGAAREALAIRIARRQLENDGLRFP